MQKISPELSFFDNDKSISFKSASGWLFFIPENESISCEELAPNSKISSLQISKTVRAELNKLKNRFSYFQLEYRFRIRFQGKIGSKSWQMDGIIRKFGNSIPLEGLDVLPWTGSLETTSKDGVLLKDRNLFDNTLPLQLILGFLQSDSNSKLFADTVLEIVGNVNLNLGPFNVLPSSLLSSSRMSFLSSSGLSNSSESDLVSGFLNDEPVLYAKSSTSCTGSNCPAYLITSLSHVVNSSVGTLCPGVTPTVSSISSQLGVDVVINQDSLLVNSISASSFATFVCPTSPGSSFSLQLSVSGSNSATWPLNMFVQDVQAAAGMIKSIPFVSSGTLTGSLQVGNKLYTALSSDLFSGFGGGRMVPDLVLTNNDIPLFQNMTTQIYSALHIGVPVLDNYAQSLFADFSSEIQTYLSSTSNPTRYGYLQFFVKKHPELQLFFSFDGDNCTFSVAFSAQGSLPQNDPSIASMDNSIQALGNLVHATYSSSKNFSIPRLSQTTPGTSRGFFTSSFSIIGLTTASTPIIRPAETNYVASTSISVTFPNTYLFNSINCTYSYRNNYSMVRARVIPAVTGSEFIVTTDPNGKLVDDSHWGSSSSGIVTQLGKIASDINQYVWVGTTMKPLNLNLGLIDGKFSFSTVMNYFVSQCTRLPNVPLPSIITDQIESWLASLSSSNTFVTSKILASSGVSTVYVEIYIYSLNSITITNDGTMWQTNLDSSRFTTPLVVEQQFIFNVNLQSRYLQVFSAVGKNTLSGFSVPFIQNMVQGAVDSGTVSININEPQSSVLVLDMKTHTDIESFPNAQISIVDQNMLQQYETLSFNIPSIILRRIPPENMLSIYRDVLGNVIPSALNGPTGIVVPPLTDSFGSLTKFSNWFTNILPWLSLPLINTPILATSSFCLNSVGGNEELILQLNNIDANCSMDILNTNFQSVVDSLNNGLKRCGGIFSYFSASFNQVDESTNCASVHFSPTIPGLIWKFNISSIGKLVFNNYWSASTVPSFGSWMDFAKVLVINLKQLDRYSNPQELLIPSTATDSLVPIELRPVYPNQFSGISISKVLLSFQEAISPHLVKSLNSTDFNVQFQINGTVSGTMTNSLISDIIGVFDTPPLGNGNNITISTNFSAPNQTIMVLPQDYSFTIIIAAEQRDTSLTVTPINVNQKITLLKGTPILQAFQRDFIGVLPQNVKPLVSVFVSPANPLVNGSYDQIRIGLSRFQVDSNTWLIPLSLGTSDSDLPFLINTTITPPRYRILNSNLLIKTDVSFEPTIDEISGKVGPIGLTLSPSSVSTTGKIEIITSLNYPYISPSTLLSALLDLDTFFSQLTLTMLLNSSFSISKFTYNVQHVNVSAPSQIFFALNEKLIFNTTGDWNNTKELLSWQVTTGGSSVISKIADLGLYSFCNFTYLADVDLWEVTNSQEGSTLLPFIGKSIGDFWEDGFAVPFNDVHGKVCTNQVHYTISSFCNLVEASFGLENVCKSSSLSDNSFDFSLQFSYSKPYSTPFEFDPNIFYTGVEPKLPVGMGSNPQLTMQVNFNVLLLFTAKFENNEIILSLQPGTSFELNTQYKLTNTISVTFGPLTLGFSGMNLDVGDPIKLVASFIDQQNYQIAVTGTSLFKADVLYEGENFCSLNVQIPNLQNYLKNPNPSSAKVWDGCNGFPSQLAIALQESPLLNYFKQPSLVTDQMNRETDTFMLKLFGKNAPGYHSKNLKSRKSILSILGKLVLPIIGRAIEGIIQKELAWTNDPVIEKELQELLIEITNEIIHGHYPHANRSEIDRILLRAFTDALNYLFKPVLRRTIATPEPNPQESYDWDIFLGRDKNFPVKTFSCDLGDHSFIELDITCSANLLFSWDYTFTLHFDQINGLTFRFNNDPIFSAVIDFSLSPNCKLSGYIGFLGAEFLPSGELKGKITIDKQFQGSVTVNANVSGLVEIGFAGKIVDMIVKSNSIQALPHWKLTMSLGWVWSLHNKDTTPDVHFSDITFCIGRLLFHLLNDVTQKFRHFLGPLDRIIGPDGILMKKVPGSQFIAGRELNVLELLYDIAETFCDGKCECKNCWDTVERWSELMYLLQDLQNLEPTDPEGCDVLQLLRNFWVDFRNPNPDPHYYGKDPGNSLVFTPNYRGDKEKVTQIFKNVGFQGKFAVKFPILRNIGKSVIDLILGKDIAVVEITIPKLVASVSAYWKFPVWPVPPVLITIGMGASLTVDVGAFIVTSNAIRNAIVNKSPQSLITGLAISTVNDDGSPHWLFVGSIYLKGGVEIDIFIFQGGAYAGIQLEGRAKLIDSYNRGFVTFDEIYWLVRLNNNILGCLDKELKLSAFFGIYIRACIPLLFTDWCFDIVRWQFHIVLFDEQFNGRPLPPSVSPHGSIDVNALPSSYGDSANPAISIYSSPQGTFVNKYDGPIQSYAPSNPPITSLVSSSYLLTTTGPVHQDSHTYMIIGMKGQFTASPSSSINLVMDLDSYKGNDMFTLTPGSISAGSLGTVLGTHCKSISLIEPAYGATFSLSGIICPVTLSSDSSSTVLISGTRKDYNGDVVVQGDAKLVQCQLSDSVNLHISDTQIISDSEFHMQIPASTQVVQVSSSNSNSVLNVDSIPFGRSLKAIGGSGDDLFIFNLRSIVGSGTLVGGRGVNSFDSTIFASNGDTVAGTNYIRQSTSSTSYLLIHKDIQKQRYFLNINKNEGLNFTLLTPQTDTSVEIHVSGDPIGSALNLFIDGCETGSEIRVFLNSSVSNVILGSDKMLLNFKCTVYVFGSSSPNQLDTITLLGFNDVRNQQWDFGPQYLRLFDPDDAVHAYMNLNFYNIDRLIAQAGLGKNYLNFIGALNTEYLFSFAVSKNTTQQNSARILSTEGAILLNGTFDVEIGPIGSSPHILDPFKSIHGQIAIVGSSLKNSIAVRAGRDDGAPAQHYRLTSSSLYPTNINGTVYPLNNVSPWMQSLLKENHINPDEKFHIRYVGNVSFFIETANGDDSVHVVNALADTTLILKKGDDKIYYVSTPHYTLNASLDIGKDEIILGVPLYQIYLDLGDDHDPDLLNFFEGDNSHDPVPQFKNNTIAPVGPDVNSFIKLTHYIVPDFVYMHRGNPPNNQISLLSQAALANEVTVINITTPGVIVNRDMQDNMTYIVEDLGESTSLTLIGTDGSSNPPVPAPRNWNVQIQIPTFTKGNIITILSERGTNGLINFIIPPNAKTPYQITVAEEKSPNGFGTILVGTLQIRIYNPDHILINTKNSLSSITVQGTAANSDLLVIGNSQCTVELQTLNNNTILVNTSNIISSSVIQSNVTIITAGSQTINNIDFSFSPQTFYDTGCFTIPSSSSFPPLSDWFIQLLNSYAVSLRASKCSVFTNATKSVTIDAPFVSIFGLNENQATTQLYTNGNIVINDSEIWGHVHIQSLRLRVPNRCEVFISDTMVATISSSVLNATTNVNIMCTDEVSASHSQWNLGDLSNDQVVSWNGNSCDGLIFLPLQYVQPLPYFNFIGASELILNITLNAADVNRTIFIDKNDISVSAYQSQWLFVNLSAQSLTSLTMHLHNGMNQVYYNSFITNPILTVSSPDITTVTISKPDGNFMFPNRELSLDWNTRRVTTSPSQASTCFQPLLECTDVAWVDLASHSTNKFCTHLHQCEGTNYLILNTTQSFKCSAKNVNSIQLNDSSTTSTPYTEWPKKVIWSVFAFICAVCICFSTFPSSSAWFLISFYIAHYFWSSLVFISFFGKYFFANWDFGIYSFVQVVNSIVSNFDNGWFCALPEEEENLHFIVIYLFISVVGLFSFFFSGYQLYQGCRTNRKNI